MYKKIKAVGVAVVTYMILLLLCASCFFMYEGVFAADREPVNPGFLFLLFSFILWGIYFILSYNEKWKGRKTGLLHVAVAGGFLTGFLMKREQIGHGFAILANEIMQKYNAYYNRQVTLFPVAENTGVEPYETLLFLLLLIFWLQAAGFFSFRRIFAVVLPPFTVFCTSLLVGFLPSGFSMICFAMGSLMLLPFKRDRYEEKGRKGSRERLFVQAKSSFLALAVFIFCVGLIKLAAGERLGIVNEFQGKTVAFQRDMEDKLLALDIWDMLEGMSRGFKKQGGVSNRTPEYAGNTVMTVKFSGKPKDTVYLRGYTGDTYENGKWGNRGEAAFDSAFPELSEGEVYDLKKMVQNLPYLYRASDPDRQPMSFEIVYPDAGSTYAYLPYFTDVNSLERLEGSGREILFHGDSSIATSGKGPLRAERVLNGGIPVDRAYQQPYQPPSGYPEYEELYEEYLSMYLSVPEELEELSLLGEELDKKLTETYGVFLADEGKEGILRETAAAYLVRRELFSRAEYSLDLPPVPRGEDVTAYFLFTSGKGFCQHYASAGTMLFRSMGIPARYVTGYAVRPNAFKEKDGSYSAEVLDSDAHAWTEIFISGRGWFPVEMTEGQKSLWNSLVIHASPENGALIFTYGTGETQFAALYQDSGQRYGGKEAIASSVAAWEEYLEYVESSEYKEAQRSDNRQYMEQPEDIQNTEQKKENDVPKDMSVSEKNQNEGNPATADGKKKGTDAVKTAVCFTAFFGVCIFLGLVAGKAVRKRKYLLSRDNRKAVRSISEKTYRLLRRKRLLNVRNPGEAEFRETVRAISGIDKGELEAFLDIMERAAFDRGEITEEEVIFCGQVCRKLKLLKLK